MSFVALTLVTLTLASSSVNAKNYINWGNEYYFNVPDDWRQIERFNVEEFLRLHGKNPIDVPHDAFFCPIDAEPFWSRAYLFVTSEKSENSFDMAEDMLKGMETEFAKMVKAQDSLGPITRLTSRKPKLDRQAQTITQVSSLNVQGVDQILHLVMQFHKSGITTFYFYSRADLYDGYVATFDRIISSFSDENLSEAQDEGEVKIVDVSSQDSASLAGATSSGSTSDTTDGGSWFADFYRKNKSFAGFAFFILAFVIFIRLRAKRGGG